MRAAILDQRITSVSYNWDGEDNASPSVQQVNGAAVFRNMANNPRFTRTSGTVEVRRNLHISPGARTTNTNFSGWSGTNNKVQYSVVQASWSSSGMAVRMSFTNVQTDTGDFYTRFTSGVTAGKTYTMVLSYVVSKSGILVVFPRVRTNDTNTAVVLTSASRNSSDGKRTATAGVVYTDWVTFVAPSMDANPSGLRMFMSIASHQTGDYIDMSMADIYEGEYQADRQWFDGSYSPDPDLTPVWVGTANASQSYLRGFVPANTSTTASFAVYSSNGLRSIPRNVANNDSLVFVGSLSSSLSGLGVTFTPGKWYGFQAVCTLLTPQTGTLSNSARRMQLVFNKNAGWTGVNSAYSIQPPNEAGSYQEELVTQIPADSVWASIRLYNGASFGNGDVYWDKLLIVEGDTEEEVRRKLAQGYFDGDTQVNAETINRVTNL